MQRRNASKRVWHCRGAGSLSSPIRTGPDGAQYISIQNCVVPPCISEMKVTPDLYTHVQPHRGWTAQQESYLENVLQQKREGRITSSKECG